MSTLWLSYKDEAANDCRVAVEGNTFSIGRHSHSNLHIVDSRLSREHALIEKNGDSYLISDRGSVNGTRVNGVEAILPTSILDGDEIDLGGLIVKANYDEATEDNAPKTEADVPLPDAEMPESSAGAPATVIPAKKKKGISPMLLLMVPMFLIVLLIFGGVLIYIVASRDKSPTNDPLVMQPSEPDEPDDVPSNPTRTPITLQVGPIGQTPQTPEQTGPLIPPPTISPTAAVEESATKFLRVIAQNDPRAFLTSEHAARVDSKVKEVKGRSGLAENINSAKRNSKTIVELATANNIKPQFLAIAALTKLGSGRGDVVATARSMAEVFGKLGPHIGTERSDDALLMVAAFDQGVAGETMKLRNMLQDMANKNPESTREIRTIWFLEKEGKITKQEFDRALTFLAIGTIAQNPKAFGVNAEVLDI